ncbi:MAG: hypothetical protein IJ792_01510, partial [Oscillospiraceae bacterium]|nr:hypothetical protein [Oscillospiraceae bacterium]
TITLYAIWEPIPAYAFTKGADGVWTKESGVTLDFTVSRDPKNDTAFTHFTGIKIDGEAVDESSYTAVSGSVNLSLKADYLETLDEGSHTLTALFDDGSAETKFTVNPVSADEPADEPTDEPETPDEPAAPIEDPVTPDQPADSNNGDQDADADGNNGNSGNSGSSGKNYAQSGNSNKNNGSGKSNSPKTGDESNLVLWVAVLTVFGGAAATAVVFGQRKRKQ